MGLIQLYICLLNKPHMLAALIQEMYLLLGQGLPVMSYPIGYHPDMTLNQKWDLCSNEAKGFLETAYTSQT